MKSKLFLSLLLFTSFMAYGSSLFTSLLDVNDRWAFENDYPLELMNLPAEVNPVQTHLLLVHQILSKRDVGHLTFNQQASRKSLLKELKLYALAEAFPKNLIHSTRRPVFIGPEGNYCAVGHLIKQSGNDALSLKLSSNMNYAYLLDMKDKELQNWVEQSGFSAKELAWIQPGYPAIAPFQPLKQGVNGKVTAIKYKGNGELIVVGGFDTAGAMYSRGIAEYISGFAGYDWFQTGGSGLVGKVYDVINFNNGIVASGDFYMADTTYVGSGVAYWDGISWTAMGEFYIGALVNTVFDLEIYNGDLYAAGFFKGDVNTTSPFYNIAKWNGTKWEGLGESPDQTVNSLKVHNGQLILGGNFQQIDANTFNHIAAYDTVNGFTHLSNGVPLPVNDIEVLGDTIFVGGRFLNTFTQDTMGLSFYHNNSWSYIDGLENTIKPENQEIMVLKQTPHGLFIGGNLDYLPAIGNIGRDLLIFKNGGIAPYAILDSTVLSIDFGDGHLYMGGHFVEGITNSGAVELNHIAKADIGTQFSIGDKMETPRLNVFPNPVSENFYIELKEENGKFPEVYDVAGKKMQIDGVFEGKLFKINTSLWPAGIYLLKISGEKPQSMKLIKL